MYVHPDVAREIARQREHELRRSVREYGQREPRRTRHRGSARHRAGWVLIEIGLALTRRSGEV
jgi:hypothetical protein